MPFAMAHPAAVLVLKRFSPRFVRVPALVVGCLTPDVAYLSGGLEWDRISHTFFGSITFGVPIGLLALLAYRCTRKRLISLLSPGRHQHLVQAALQPLGSPVMIVCSLILGAWTHVLWDSLTHKDGWFVEHLPALRATVFHLGGHVVRVHHAAWYACSFIGVFCLCVACAKWRQRWVGMPGAGLEAADWFRATLVATAVIPIALVHHLMGGFLGDAIVAVASLALFIAAALSFGDTGPKAVRGSKRLRYDSESYESASGAQPH